MSRRSNYFEFSGFLAEVTALGIPKISNFNSLAQKSNKLNHCL